jgi:hypothetical protein
MEVARQELRPDVARQLVLFGQNITAAAAVQAGVFDEMVDSEALLERALAKANEFTALPQMAFARSKRQLRSRAYVAIEAAIAGAEPLLDGWLSGKRSRRPLRCSPARLEGIARQSDGQRLRRISNRSAGMRSRFEPCRRPGWFCVRRMSVRTRRRFWPVTWSRCDIRTAIDRSSYANMIATPSPGSAFMVYSTVGLS